MTMLMMWLDKISVALATDSKMTGTSNKVIKLHRFQLADKIKIMFGIGFGEGAFDWLVNCPCPNKHPYPEHWCICSNAQNLDELEQIIRNDLQTRNFPPKSQLELWLAGFNEKGSLEAFVIDGTGQRIRELIQDEVIFNSTAINSVRTPLDLLIDSIGTQPTKLEQRFRALKKDLDDKQVEFSGVKALEIVGREVIDLCEKSDNPYIGGPLNYQAIFNV